MSLKPVNTKYQNKLVCDFCGFIQDEIGWLPTEHIGEDISNECPACNIGKLQYKQVPIIEYIDEEDL